MTSLFVWAIAVQLALLVLAVAVVGLALLAEHRAACRVALDADKSSRAVAAQRQSHV